VETTSSFDTHFGRSAHCSHFGLPLNLRALSTGLQIYGKPVPVDGDAQSRGIWRYTGSKHESVLYEVSTVTGGSSHDAVSPSRIICDGELRGTDAPSAPATLIQIVFVYPGRTTDVPIDGNTLLVNFPIKRGLGTSAQPSGIAPAPDTHSPDTIAISAAELLFYLSSCAPGREHSLQLLVQI
jgi:hypothetical protein